MRDALGGERAQLQPRFRLLILKVIGVLLESDKLAVVSGNDAPARVRSGNSKAAVPDRFLIGGEPKWRQRRRPIPASEHRAKLA